jgi:type IV pilus assembly protein PilN
MIKINLLEVEKERRTKTAAAPAGAFPTGLAFIGIVGLTLLLFGFLFWQTSNALSTLEKDVAQKREKRKELDPYIKKVEELEKRRNELALKNNAIETLRSQRTIPVHLMDEISRALPEYLWLTNVTLKGGVIGIEGETVQEQAIPTFMSNLDASEFIGTPSLIETKMKNATGGPQTASTTFKIAAPVTNPFKPKEPEISTATTTTKTKKK